MSSLVGLFLLGQRASGPTAGDLGGAIVAFLVYGLLLFVVSYIVVEFGQSYFYDEKTPRAGLKVLASSAILALILTWTRSSFDTMFTSELGNTVILAIAAFVVFTLVLRFHPQHAAPIGIISVLLVAGLGTLGVDSLQNKTAAALPDVQTSRPIRVQTGKPALKTAETPKE
jgi:uncharacterized membrane protein